MEPTVIRPARVVLEVVRDTVIEHVVITVLDAQETAPVIL